MLYLKASPLAAKPMNSLIEFDQGPGNQTNEFLNWIVVGAQAT